MTDPPPILDYQHPPQAPTPRRSTNSAVARFAFGNGVAFLAILAMSTLYGEGEDAPGLVCCGTVLWLGANAGLFALINFLRGAVTGTALSERNRLWTVLVGIFNVCVSAGVSAIMPQNAAHAALIFFGGCIGAIAAASWAAMRSVPRTAA